MVEERIIYGEFRALIVKSCDFETAPTMEFRDFHHEYLKLYFGVMDIKINYVDKSIALWSSKPIDANSFSLQNINKSVVGTVEYDNLESTLLGCVEESEFHERFYKYFLLKYGQNNELSNASVNLGNH